MADIVKQSNQQVNLQTMKNVITQYSSQIQQLIPKHVTAERIVNIALTALTRNPDLLECDPRTVLAGIIQSSILGLELHSPLHHASLVKFWNSKAGINEATLMIEYPGLIELVMRGNQVSYVEAQPVYAEDFLDVEYGTNPHITHKPQVHTARGKLIGAYAYAKQKDGETKFHYMTAEDIEKRRNISKAKDSGPWKTWEEEMYAKTPLRHLCKQIRKTTELSIALEHENRLDQGITGIVEGPEGLSMDFLSMNIEAKTLDAKENLKNRIADKSESARQQQNARTQAPPTPPASQAPTPTAAASTERERMENVSKGLQETKDRIAEQARIRDAAQSVRTTEPVEEQVQEGVKGGPTEPAPEEFTESVEQLEKWGEEAQDYPPTPAPASRPSTRRTAPAAQPPPPAQPAPVQQPTTNKLEQAQVMDLLREIKKASVPDTKVRLYLDSFNPKVRFIRDLTADQKDAMINWINQGSWKQ